MFRQAPSFPYHDLGIVEDGNTASRAISKDAYVIWNGSSYFASTDILQGATLEEDVNLTAIPDGVINGVVSALNNKFIPGTTATEIVTYTGSGEQTYNVTFEEGMYGIYAMNGLLNIRYAGVFGFGVLSNEAITSVMNAGYVPAGTHEVRFKGNASSSKGVIAKLF